MNRIVLAVVAVIALAVGVIGLYGRNNNPVISMTPTRTDLVAGRNNEVADTFICDTGDPRVQVREWHFGGADRSLRNQSTVDWYLNFGGRRVRRIEYTLAGFPRDGKKYMRIVRRRETNREREGFDFNGDDDQLRWADFVEHNVVLEAQRNIPRCGPAR